MKVVKRDGRLQQFDINKIKTTLQNTSEDVKEAFTASDVENISENIEKKIFLLKRDRIESAKIKEFVISELKNCNFKNIAERYESGK